MSWIPDFDPTCPEDASPEAIETLIVPRARDVAGFAVRRALPAPRRQMVGPFIFFDQMGPAEFLTGSGLDIRPHPHIGLGTVTYLFSGDLRHQDSTGADQLILPGELNWMVAGRGVSHSERTSAPARTGPHALSGIQTWIALPEAAEDMAPRFEHHGAAALPQLQDRGLSLRLLLGSAYGAQAPATLFSEAFYADAQLAPGALLPLPDEHEDRGLYVLTGAISVAGQSFEAGQMLVFRPGDRLAVQAGEQGARLVVLGGATLNGPRYIWWNFVASSRERIEEAKRQWRAARWGEGLFDLPPQDRAEHIPLPQPIRVRAGGRPAEG